MKHNYKTAKKGLILGIITSVIFILLSPMIYDVLIIFHYPSGNTGSYSDYFSAYFNTYFAIFILCTAPLSIGAMYYLTFRYKYI